MSILKDKQVPLILNKWREDMIDISESLELEQKLRLCNYYKPIGGDGEVWDWCNLRECLCPKATQYHGECILEGNWEEIEKEWIRERGEL